MSGESLESKIPVIPLPDGVDPEAYEGFRREEEGRLLSYMERTGKKKDDEAVRVFAEQLRASGLDLYKSKTARESQSA